MTPRNIPTFLDATEGRSVDPSHLESLGKQAARFAELNGLSLSDAVTQTVGHEKLNAEQVRRVVEFTNLEAFHRKYSSLDPSSRIVHIDGGPADPVQVLQDLNDGARPREVTIHALEYSMPPETKTASIGAFVPEIDRSRSGVVGDIIGLRSKLAAAHEEAVQGAEAAHFTMNEALVSLAGLVKRAGLQGAAVADIYEAWFRESPDLAKVAFARVKHLVPSTNTKVASRVINPAHPVVDGFRDFVKAAQAFGHYSKTRQEIEAEMVRVSGWLEHNGG